MSHTQRKGLHTIQSGQWTACFLVLIRVSSARLFFSLSTWRFNLDSLGPPSNPRRRLPFSCPLNIPLLFQLYTCGLHHGAAAVDVQTHSASPGPPISKRWFVIRVVVVVFFLPSLIVVDASPAPVDEQQQQEASHIFGCVNSFVAADVLLSSAIPVCDAATRFTHSLLIERDYIYYIYIDSRLDGYSNLTSVVW